MKGKKITGQIWSNPLFFSKITTLSNLEPKIWERLQDWIWQDIHANYLSTSLEIYPTLKNQFCDEIRCKKSPKNPWPRLRDETSFFFFFFPLFFSVFCCWYYFFFLFFLGSAWLRVEVRKWGSGNNSLWNLGID